MLAVFYAVFVWARPPLTLFGGDMTWLTAALFAIAAAASALSACCPQHRTHALPFIVAAPLFRGITLLIGEETATTPAGQIVAALAYLTIFTAIVCIHVLSVPMAADYKHRRQP